MGHHHILLLFLLLDLHLLLAVHGAPLPVLGAADVLAGLEPGDEVPVGGHGPQPVQELLRLGLVRRRSLAPELGLEYIIPRPDVAGCNILQLFLARSRPRWNMWCSGTCEGGE